MDNFKLITLNLLLTSYFSRYIDLNDGINNLLENRTSETQEIIVLLKSFFKDLSDSELYNVLRLYCINIKNQPKLDNFEFIGTLPTNPYFHVRNAYFTTEELINQTNNELIITCYSISDYSSSLIELIRRRLRDGVRVIFLLDKYSMVNYLQPLKPFINNNLLVYTYNKDLSTVNDYSSLHAKVIISDYQSAIVTSSNLSKNGFERNIEIGVLVRGNQVNNLRDTFTLMIQNNNFVKIKTL